MYGHQDVAEFREEKASPMIDADAAVSSRASSMPFVRF